MVNSQIPLKFIVESGGIYIIKLFEFTREVKGDLNHGIN